MRRLLGFVLAPFLLTLAACDPAATAPDAVASRAPALDRADGADQADHDCRVVLREVARLPNATWTGYEEACTGDTCAWVFTGHVDVSKDAFPAGATVGVLYHLAGDPTWWEVPAAPVAGGRPGFFSHEFKLHEHLGLGDATDEATLAAARVEVIPFLARPDGGRLFDHNRRRGDFDSYAFGQAEWWTIPEEAACAPVVGTLGFQEGWQQSVGGALHAGGWLVVNYDLDRLPDCRGTHNGYPAWDTVASVRFLPGGQLVEGSVRDFVTTNGTPTTVATERALEVRVPTDATAVELWFHNYSGAGQSCDAWDSAYGANYRFDVLPPVDDPRCQDVERWTRIYGGTATCTPYAVTAQGDADGCELYVSGIGHGYEGHYGIPFEWLEVYLTVRPSEGDVLDAGLYVRYVDSRDGAVHQRLALGTPVDGGTYKTGFTILSTAIQGLPGYRFSVEALAFFVDVRRPDGTVVRRWQSRGGADYTWDDAFGAGTTTQSIPYGNVQWAVDGAGVYDVRRGCQ
jgi:hypothetical protein